MKDIVKDWCKFCEGEETYDKSYFYTLFWQDQFSKDELYEIFKYFPNSNELLDLMFDYIYDCNIIEDKSTSYLMQLVKNDISEKTSLSDNLKYIKNYPVEFVDDYNFVKNKIDSEEYYKYYDEVSDVLADRWIIEDKKTFALYEAFYGLTKSYEIVWYLFSPLISTKINYKYYVDIMMLGGVYTIYNNKILVSKEI
ncbi:hypothetical protein IUY40_16715 [Flavobacterium sp. ALJ2]|uniref:hypothetical protein n=1 Tax=Flavobacterium sp. ALJ2 TaxID=2786960 RepID=UPI00189CDBF9|nr:hypothetical protein [Flavobacterium sp. ALJ2]MBF7093176.1 hypothetical protein [Flavobacterium sp. ALJ2]